MSTCAKFGAALQVGESNVWANSESIQERPNQQLAQATVEPRQPPQTSMATSQEVIPPSQHREQLQPEVHQPLAPVSKVDSFEPIKSSAPPLSESVPSAPPLDEFTPKSANIDDAPLPPSHEPGADDKTSERKANKSGRVALPAL